MAKRNFGEKIKLSTYDEMFGTESIGHDDQKSEGQIINVPLSELHTFENHPFRVLDDEKMEETVESVKTHGVLVPGIARPRRGGGYEIISGHRRRRASELAGKTEMPFMVREYTDDEATIIMVDRLPKALITDARFKDITNNAKALTFLMLLNHLA